MLVILFCALGHDVLYVFWPLLAGIFYIAAPVLYNPKPTWGALLEAVDELWCWGYQRDDTIDSDVFKLIHNQRICWMIEQKSGSSRSWNPWSGCGAPAPARLYVRASRVSLRAHFFGFLTEQSLRIERKILGRRLPANRRQFMAMFGSLSTDRWRLLTAKW